MKNITVIRQCFRKTYEQGSILRDLKIGCFNEVKYKNIG